MKITFVSNYINHHQTPIANALYEKIGSDYCFIQTQPMEADRVQMGWESKVKEIPYLLKYYENSKLCKEKIETSDIVIFGGVEDESYIKKRLEQGKIVIRYCERLYKEGVWKAVSPKGLIKKYHDHTRYKRAPVFLLCAGGYVAYDFSIIHAYKGKRFKWGYFPETRYPDKEELFLKKDTYEKENNDVIQLLWVARFIECKHPEAVLALAEKMKENKFKFNISVVGGGELEGFVKEEIQKRELSDVITLKGFLSPDEVREEMEKAKIFLFTSDFIEGWGTVLNEAMNAGCIVVASHAAGGASFLIEDGKNGYVYRYGDGTELFAIVKELLENKKKQKQLGEKAYDTITKTWNVEHAAQVLLKLCKNLIMERIEFEKEGPLSEAHVIPQHKMYSHLKKD